MSALNFPNNPALNDIYHANGSSWKWDGDRWRRIADPGSQGVIGAQGAQGAQGHQGLAGAQGAQGVQGAQGHQGRQGAQGVQGAAGAVGAQGNQGVQGAAGTVGSQGAQGHQGVQGATGSAGAQGAPGTATINNNANDRLITGSNTAGELNAEADITFNGNKLKLNDNKRIDFGTNDDLKIYHTNDLSSQNDSEGNAILAGDNWCSYIQESGTGPLIFKSNGGPSTGAFQFYDTSWRSILKLYSGTGARVALHYAGVEKLITDAGGISITGGIKDKDGELGTSGQVLSSTGTQLNWVANTAGAQGAQGHQGVQGAEGNFGGATFEYKFSTNTTDSDPTPGFLKMNNANVTLANRLFIDDTDGGDTNTDIQPFLRTIDDSTSTIKGHFRISNKLNADDFALYTISAITEATGYFSVACAHVSGSASSFSNNEDVIITFARTGDKGEVGAQGAQGRQGSPGAQGAQGHQGVQGATGAQGHQGVQGAQGHQGHQGVQGAGGSTGAQGHQGHQGVQGAQGEQGATGAGGGTGAQGHQGRQGAQGEQGATGAGGGVGAQGHQGKQGAGGSTGNNGAQGAQGRQGAQGEQGATGGGGGVGAQGATGATGAQGVQGATGSGGGVGAQGAQGRQGATGSGGAQGHQGRQGATGSGGSTGSQGHQGRQGATGPSHLVAHGYWNGSLGNNYNISSTSGSFSNDDTNDAYDGGLWFNLSSNTDEAPYAVVASGRLEARGDIRRITIHCIEMATNRFRIAGFRYTDANDQGTTWQYPTQVSFIAMDD